MILDHVRHALNQSRPGRAAQLHMSPRPRPDQTFPSQSEIFSREASVLILLYPHRAHGDLHFFLTRRTDTVETHKGQISLPGGSQEPGETLMQTALREASEELALDPACVQLLGEPLSSLFVPVSGFRITPFVGFSPMHPNVIGAPAEIAEIIETPLETLVDPRCVIEETWTLREREFIVPYYAVNGHKVWGATAMILSEFAEMLKKKTEVR